MLLFGLFDGLSQSLRSGNTLLNKPTVTQLTQQRLPSCVCPLSVSFVATQWPSVAKDHRSSGSSHLIVVDLRVSGDDDSLLDASLRDPSFHRLHTERRSAGTPTTVTQLPPAGRLGEVQRPICCPLPPAGPRSSLAGSAKGARAREAATCSSLKSRGFSL